MNFVQLTDDLRFEGGISGDIITTVQGVTTGESYRIKRWVQDAWIKIQIKERWNFLKFESSYEIQQYESILSPPEFLSGDVADWDDCTARIAKQGDGYGKSDMLRVEEYDWFREFEGRDPTKRGKPQVIAVDPRLEALHIAPAADQAYELFYDYWAVPQSLDEDVDVPIMPAQFHKLIVWVALETYGGYEAAPDVINRARAEASPLWNALYRDQLPSIRLING